MVPVKVACNDTSSLQFVVDDLTLADGRAGLGEHTVPHVPVGEHGGGEEEARGDRLAAVQASEGGNGANRCAASNKG